MSTASSSGPDLAAITQHQQKMWSEGDFAAAGGLYRATFLEVVITRARPGSTIRLWRTMSASAS